MNLLRLRNLRTFGALVLCFFQVSARAEILHNIDPIDKFGDIKRKYPQAAFTKVNAAWVTPEKAFFEMKGEGFPGTLMLTFFDLRPVYKSMAAKSCAKNSGRPPSDCDSDLQAANLSDEEALRIEWVRWVPAKPIPLERFQSKYGPPTKVDYDDATLEPTAAWEQRAMIASLSDDKRMVKYVTSWFTLQEQRQDWIKRKGYVPESLKETAVEEVKSANRAPSQTMKREAKTNK